MERDDEALLLIVGNDLVLLRTRAAVLRASGFRAIMAHGSDQARMAGEYFAFTAALLCHTLDPEEQDALATDFGSHAKREMPIMKLYLQECQPESLIASVRKLVDRSSAPQVLSAAPSYELA